MSAIPPEIEGLLRDRDAARAARDYATADALRERIDALGYEIRDSPDGATAVPKPRFALVDPAAVPERLRKPATRAISVHVLDEGHDEDVLRFVDSFAAHCSAHDYEIVVANADPRRAEAIESLLAGRDRVVTLHLARDDGWAASRNAAMKTSSGAIVAVADLSVEATGDLIGPVLEAFADPAVGVAGPWGIVSSNLRDFEPAEGRRADAIEGYFLATRAELAARQAFDEGFRWYRHADIEYSFRLRSLGFQAVVTDPCAIRHTHRAWAALETDPAERDKRSKRNFNRFLDRFRDRTDLLIANGSATASDPGRETRSPGESAGKGPAGL